MWDFVLYRGLTNICIKESIGFIGRRTNGVKVRLSKVGSFIDRGSNHCQRGRVTIIGGGSYHSRERVSVQIY